VNTSVESKGCAASCNAVPVFTASAFSGTATALVLPSHITAEHASNVVKPPYPHVYVTVPVYPDEHVNTSVESKGCAASCAAVPVFAASAFSGVGISSIVPLQVTASHATVLKVPSGIHVDVSDPL
jgi:chloramphenicol O-acetyltransferase